MDSLFSSLCFGSSNGARCRLLKDQHNGQGQKKKKKVGHFVWRVISLLFLFSASSLFCLVFAPRTERERETGRKRRRGLKSQGSFANCSSFPEKCGSTENLQSILQKTWPSCKKARFWLCHDQNHNFSHSWRRRRRRRRHES